MRLPGSDRLAEIVSDVPPILMVTKLALVILKPPNEAPLGSVALKRVAVDVLAMGPWVVIEPVEAPGSKVSSALPVVDIWIENSLPGLPSATKSERK